MKIRAILILSVYSVLVIMASVWMAKHAYSWLPPEASAESKLVDDLFSLFTGLATAVYLGTMGPLAYALIFHRAAKYDLTDAQPIEGSTWLEITWTGLPLILVLALAFASYRTYEKMAIAGPMHLVHLPKLEQSAMAAPFDSTPQQQIQKAVETAPIENIDVIARQWAWIFRYPEQNVTSTELHLPVGHRIKFKLHSEDVLHGFYIPAFRLDQYIVPGQDINFELTPVKPGTYRLRDGMISGTYFAANQADVVVQPVDEYEQWLADAATQTPKPAFNPAVNEYMRGQAEGRAKEKTAVRGWATIAPAPPPVVNYAPEPGLNSPATREPGTKNREQDV